jgi:hypothetical protein
VTKGQNDKGQNGNKMGANWEGAKWKGAKWEDTDFFHMFGFLTPLSMTMERA